MTAAAAARALRPPAWRLAAPDRHRLRLFGPAAAAWLVLLLQGRGMLPPALCLSPVSSAPSRYFSEWQAFLASPAFAGTLQTWSLMLVAMMMPLLGGPLFQIEARSLPSRRGRGRALFLAGYGLAWAAALGAMMALLVGLRSLGPGWAAPFVAPGLLVLAAWWQGTSFKRRALTACHRPAELRAFGWPGAADCVAFGLAHGAACAGSCGVAMLALIAAGHDLAAMAVVALILLVERYEMRPQVFASQILLLLLAFAGLAAVATGA